MVTVNAYDSFEFMVMRTPLLPMYECLNNKKNLFISDTDNYESLLQKINTSLFAEALLISSPDLYKELQKIKEGGITEENRNALRKILCYFFRMSVRPTPFGISAGVSVVNTGPVTGIRLNPVAAHRKKVNINFDFINNLYGVLRNDPAFLKQQSYFTNTSVYRNFKGFHFTKVSRLPYMKSSIPYSGIIDNILSYAKNSISYARLMKYMTDELSYPQDMSEMFLEKLIQMELLLPAIYPSLFDGKGPGAFTEIIESAGIKKGLWQLAKDIEQYERTEFGKGTEIVEKINQCMDNEASAEKLHVISEFSLGSGSVNHNITKEINKGLLFLFKLRGLKGCNELKRFTAEFALRYGTKEVSLCEALDEHTGIGYPVLKKPFIRNKLTEHLRHIDLDELSVDKVWDGFLLKLLTGYYENKEQEIVLTDNDLTKLNSGLIEADLTETIYCTFNLLGKSNEEIDKGNYLVDFLFAGGPSCMNPLNRFSHLSEELDNKLRICSQWENEYYKNNDLHCAEINFIPRQGIGGNILMRGNFRENEIPVMTSPTPGKSSFHINDIYLYQESGKLFAIDKKSGMKILPVATVMYDNHNTASVNYNSFLTDLGHQEKVYNLGWTWGSLQTVLHHFPRVRYGKCVLSKEMWRIKLSEADITAADFKSELKLLLKKKGIPMWVNYIEKTDNLLFLNLKNEVCIDILESKLKKYGQVLLCENLSDRNNTFVESDAGFHSNEFILPMRLSDSILSRQQFSVLAGNERSNSCSKYSHIRICCNHFLADEVISLMTMNFCNSVTGNRLINFWREDSPPAIVFMVQENADREIAVADVELLFSAYKECNHIYNITVSCSEDFSNDKILPEALVYRNTGMAVDLMRELKRRKDLPAPELRFITFLLIGVQYAKKLFESSEERQSVIGQLLVEKDQAIRRSAPSVQKKTLALAYRQIIEQIETHYNSVITGIKEHIVPWLGEENEYLGIREKGSAFYAFMELSGNKLLYSSLTDSEWIISLDFIKQYLHHEANLGKYKKIYL